MIRAGKGRVWDRSNGWPVEESGSRSRFQEGAGVEKRVHAPWAAERSWWE